MACSKQRTDPSHIDIIVVGERVEHLCDRSFDQFESESTDAAAPVDGKDVTVEQTTQTHSTKAHTYSHVYEDDHVFRRWRSLNVPEENSNTSLSINMP